MTRRRRTDPGSEGLAAIHAELEVLFSGSSCPRSTRCCRFRETGRTPYVWPVEARAVLRAVARLGGRLVRGGGEGDCPLLREDGACSVYESRPFGCRTHFCGEAQLPGGRRRPEVDALAQRLRGLSEALGERELLPLTTVLARAFDRDGRQRR